jgi:hypothetical protein
MRHTTPIILIALILLGNMDAFSKPGPDRRPYEVISMFPGAPNPCDSKILIRSYLPENDPFSSIRILSADSTLVKEISLAYETGISSTPIWVGDWKAGTYIYQLFYKGETKYTGTLVVKH